ncbi:hypothetical protein DEG02_008930 [Xanthomonas vasicola]|nr:hypothetical protein KWO_002320 [Xanthomonas vasicola pv. musacearum NCPPB 4379]KFA04095.1 hypothetical protein KWQ_0122345 [Xanthomonas vasicola pv. musacearum NCPPB 4380]KFA04701.1 hypothetical protein KWM_0120135 [Xanthomonas vasicola pv. musacearum NCPPB 2005]KFA15897.1 hypothetical protein A11G_0120400 [Xanthomonas vasicola pv. musacearum NCPPB 4392]KFA19580.1 hypothetical protein KWU_0116990 [Xanthomonas vasicola pv. musacearum NCPPB 4394]KFA26984.1 hypothetical protein KWS_0118340 [X
MAQLIRLVPQVESDPVFQLAQLFHASELSLRQTVKTARAGACWLMQPSRSQATAAPIRRRASGRSRVRPASSTS